MKFNKHLALKIFSCVFAVSLILDISQFNVFSQSDNTSITPPKPSNTIVKMTAAKSGKGVYFNIRNDLKDSLSKAIKDINNLGGVLTASSGLRGLNESVSTGRSSASLHYLGRAVDLSVSSGMTSSKDTYIVVKDQGSGTNPTWKIYCRTNNKSVPSMELTGCIWRKGSDVKTFKASGRFICITDILEQYGWNRISSNMDKYRYHTSSMDFLYPYLMVSDGWIYYMSAITGSRKLKRLSSESDQRDDSFLVDASSSEFIYSGNAFYCDEDITAKFLVCMNLVSKIIYPFKAGNYSNICVYDNNIYYLYKGQGLYKTDLNSLDTIMLCDASETENFFFVRLLYLLLQ